MKNKNLAQDINETQEFEGVLETTSDDKNINIYISTTVLTDNKTESIDILDLVLDEIQMAINNKNREAYDNAMLKFKTIRDVEWDVATNWGRDALTSKEVENALDIIESNKGG